LLKSDDMPPPRLDIVRHLHQQFICTSKAVLESLD
jgi:hypothetical protein